jgi:hypothetical protein
MPAAQNAVVSSVTPAEIGKASGVFNMLRYFGGAFGVAVMGAAFAAAGSFATPGTFAAGFIPAIGVAATLSLIGAMAGSWLPSRDSKSTGPVSARV